MARAPLALLLLAALAASAAAVQLTCEKATGTAASSGAGKTGCSECWNEPNKAPNFKTCFYCTYRNKPIWTGTTQAPVFDKCQPYSTGAACTTNAAGPQDPNCELCDNTVTPPVCIKCKEGFGYVAGKNANGLPNFGTKCKQFSPTFDAYFNTAAKKTAFTKLLSANSACAALHPDGTCKQCADQTQLLVPVNALWLDAGYPETQCMTRAAFNAEFKRILGANPTTAQIPAACAEVDTALNCIACKKGFYPKLVATNNPTNKLIQCVAFTNANNVAPNKCDLDGPYMQYCLECAGTTVTGRATCVSTTTALAGKSGVDGCLGSRSRTGGTKKQCGLNCKGLFGINCKTCSATACLTLDTISR